MVSHENEVLALLTDERNRAILRELGTAPEPLDLHELADRLVRSETPIVETGEYERELEQTVVSLHHHLLPKLADSGVVEYHPEERTVVGNEYAAVEAEWLDLGRIDEAVARFRADRGTAEEGVGILEGKEAVYEYGRRLADEAEEELFLIYTSDNLLDEGCLPQARNAIERGVDIAAGSANPDVREFFRTNLPEATIWEPQLDWMNDPTTYPRVDRLIFSDREAIIFGLLDDPDGRGDGVETAMVGRGEQNPLVAFARELLGPRLDHLDHQSEDFQSGLTSGS